MRPVIPVLLLFSTLGTALCQGPVTAVPVLPPIPPGWERVEQMQVDQAIAVLERGRRGSLSCRVDRVDDFTLTCIQTSPYAPSRRIVYPVGSVAAVYTEELTFCPGRAELIVGSVAGAALGGVIGGQVSVGGGFAGAAIGGLFGLSIALGHHDVYPRPPRVQRRLLYSAP